MKEEEIDDVLDLMDDFLVKYLDKIVRMQVGLCDRMEAIDDYFRKVSSRMLEIERMINAHAVGVQNVYNEFNKIFIDESLINKLSQLKEIFEGK